MGYAKLDDRLPYHRQTAPTPEAVGTLKRLVIVANEQTRKVEATMVVLRAALDGLVDAVEAIRCEETYCAADDERLEAALLDARAALQRKDRLG